MYDVSVVVGGEGMSESPRAALRQHLRKAISCFGASHKDINMAGETPFTVALRQSITPDERLGIENAGVSNPVFVG